MPVSKKNYVTLQVDVHTVHTVHVLYTVHVQYLLK